MSSTEPTYGILGVGAIATATVRGLCEGVAEAPSVVLSPRNGERAAGLAAGLRSVRVASGNQAVVDASDVVIICLLPVDTADALAEPDFPADQAVVSAVAGLPVVQLAELVAPATDVARSISLPAVATRDSITPVASGDICGNPTIPRGGRRDWVWMRTISAAKAAICWSLPVSWTIRAMCTPIRWCGIMASRKARSNCSSDTSARSVSEPMPEPMPPAGLSGSAPSRAAAARS